MDIHEFFDVLSISDDNGNVDIIQSLMGSDCLGTHFNNGIAKLYFQGGIKSKIESQLQQINTYPLFKWKWKNKTRKIGI